jgi:shikimate kinase
MNNLGNIFLIGPMGAGKSTVGRRLAHGLGLEFLDSDKEIEQRTGVTIAMIFDLEGEAGFRGREKTVIADLTQRRNIVLATGGGVVLDCDNRCYLKKQGTVIYLNASVKEQLRRVGRDKTRPLLQTDDRLRQIKKLMTIRDPLYREVADIIINTDGYQVKRVVHNILRRLDTYSQASVGQDRYSQ